MRTNWSTLSVPISRRMSRSVKVAAIKVVHWVHAENWPVPFRLLARAGHHSYKITSDNNARYRYTISFCHLCSTNEFVFDRFRHWIHTSIGSPVTFCPATPTCQNEKKTHLPNKNEVKRMILGNIVCIVSCLWILLLTLVFVFKWFQRFRLQNFITL